MSKNYTVFFILLFSSSILGGYALKDSVEYAVTIGYGLGIVFLLLAFFYLSKRRLKTYS